mmetsp:Transcript_115682/g.323508  ORF Transcript_115682/g.323508 Transcript_115682/m.323508 type:complete len:243 (-) Transcript_115682:631-1359(-)
MGVHVGRSRPWRATRLQGLEHKAHLFELLVHPCAIEPDADDVLGPSAALEPHGDAHELLRGDPVASVDQHLEQMVPGPSVELQDGEVRLDVLVLQDIFELLPSQHAVAVGVGDLEEEPQLLGIGLLLPDLLLDHQLGVGCGDAERVPEEQSRDDSEGGEGDTSDVQHKEERIDAADILHKSSGVCRPSTAECQLEEGPQGSRRRAVVAKQPLAGRLVDRGLEHDGLYGLAQEQGGDQHHQAQ